MTDSTYNYVDEFYVWVNSLDGFEDTRDQLYNQICGNNITDDTDNYNKYKEICLYFTKSMDYIVEDNGFLPTPESRKGICAYLNYYLNSELKKITNPKEKVEQFYTQMKASAIRYSFDLTKCDGKIENIGNNILNEMEYIHNLFFNVQKYIDNIKNVNEAKCSFAQKCYDSYKEGLNKCDNSSTNIFCEKMKKFKNDYKTYMSNTTCGVAKDLPEFGQNHIDGIQSGLRRDATPSDDISNLLHGKIGTLTLTTPGIVIGLSVLYKFTPIGTRISQLLRRKNNIIQKIQEQNDDNSLFHSDNLHRSSSNSNYNITYQQY